MISGNTDADAALGRVGLPVVVKPVRSWVREGQNGRRLRAIVAGQRSLALEAINELLGEGTDVVAQEWLPGDREALSVMYARGRFWARFAQRADRMLPPLGGSSIARESIPLSPDITRAAEALVEHLGLEGYSEIEFRRDIEGRPALMEINPRLSASIEIAVRAGVPFPRLLFDWASGEELQEVAGYRTGIRMRWLGGDLSWLRAVLGDPGHPDAPSRKAATLTFLRDFGRRSGYDYLERRDLRPALVAALGGTRRIRGRLPSTPAGPGGEAS